MLYLYEIHDGLVRFARDESGSGSVEAMLMIPLWVWSFLACYVFFDAYRVQSINAKAGYTIGDILSRQQSYITPEFVDSMHMLQQSLVDSRTMPRLRISSFIYDQDADQLLVNWSEVRGGGDELTDARLATMRNAIPQMYDGEIGILVQTSVEYEPLFAAGISEMDFDDFVVTSPRVGQACFHPVNAGGVQAVADQECVVGR